MQLQSARGTAVDAPIAIEGWILANPTGPFEQPNLSAGVRICPACAITHHQTQTNRASNQALAFAEGNVYVRKITAEDGLSLSHLQIGFAWDACRQPRRSYRITPGRQPIS